MKDLKQAIELTLKYNRMELEDVVKEFEEYSDQEIPKHIVMEFKLMGFTNEDFLASDFLNNRGFKNILQIKIEE